MNIREADREHDQTTGVVYNWIIIKTKTGKRGQKQSWLGEVHQGGEGPHWIVVPPKKK